MAISREALSGGSSLRKFDLGAIANIPRKISPLTERRSVLDPKEVLTLAQTTPDLNSLRPRSGGTRGSYLGETWTNFYGESVDTGEDE